MALHISVRDYRGIERADVELAPICLVGGKNEQGKSCLAEAARAALAGVAIPIPGVNKKDAKLLVRDGAEKGSATASDETGEVIVSWPKADVNSDSAGDTWCSPFAVGLRHLLDLDDKERANILAGYINSTPAVTDVAAALEDIGYGQKAVDSLWKTVNGPDGWDGAHKKAREYGTKLKGQWENVTGEKYGSKKAESWTPAGWTDDLDAVPREALVEVVGHNEAALERAIGLRAVAEANVDELRERAASIRDLEKQERKERAEKERLFDEHRALKVKAVPPIPQKPTACPKCEAPLAVRGDTLVEVTDAPTDKDIAEAEEAHRQHLAAVEIANEKFETAYREHHSTHEKLVEARHCNLKLDKIKQLGGGSATEEAVEAARADLELAQKQLAAFDAKAQADKLHAEFVKNDKLAAILAPDGLRRRKLASGLDDLNERLADLCAASKWRTVRIDENLKAHYGTRPVWAASASGQWRARVIIQFAMAQMDGSAAVVIDEVDILDARGRNGLMHMIRIFSVRALVCLTANKPELVPDLQPAMLGASYWIEDGIAKPIAEAKEEAE